MSGHKNFRRAEPNRVTQPKLHMTRVVEDPLSKTGFSGPFVLSPTTSDLENSAAQPTSRISRDGMDNFSKTKSDNAHGGHFSVAPAQAAGPTPEKDLALGVLKQTAQIGRAHV